MSFSSHRNNSINQKIYERNIPSHNLQPYLNVRPVMTKYSILPIVDPRKETPYPLTQVPIYNIHKSFNPGNAQAPWSGYSSNINVESDLRSQIFALQSCDQSVYVPKSTSDLYKYSFASPNNNYQEGTNHDLLFKEESFDEVKYVSENTQIRLFNNFTRTNLNTFTKGNNSNL
jgi:hypothetical protein